MLLCPRCPSKRNFALFSKRDSYCIHKLNRRLKGDLQSLRRKEALCIETDEVDNHPPLLGGRACSRCRGELGRIINRGANCPSCNQRVCKSCRHYDTNRWLCLVCYKQLEQLSGSTAGTDRNANVNSERAAERGDLINSNIQRSCSFSDVDPPSWSFLRCSPDMRAYSSMPRNRILDYSVRIGQDERIIPESNYDPILRLFPRTPVNGNSPELLAKHSLETTKTEVLDDLSPLSSTPITSPEQSPVVDKRDITSVTSTSSFIRNLSFRKREAGHSWYIPPGVTPPRSRRRLNTGDSHDDQDMGTLDKGLTPESDDYKLVFISSSDSSSREELHSDDASSTSSGRVGLLDDADWDYFECWPCLKRETPECGSVGPDRPQPPGDINSCPATVGPCVPIVPIHVPIPVPFPFPVPFFVPVPVPSSFLASAGYAMTTSQDLKVLPDSEVLPLDEVLCHKAVSPVLVRDPDENSVVLKVYKSLDETDNAVSPTPEDILRLTEARLKDFTDIKDDNSVSSVSSDEDDENRVPSTRTYKLNQSDNSSCEFSIAASPPKSLTSASTSDDSSCSDDDQKQPKKTFSRTFILHESSSELSDDDDKGYELLENESGDNGEANEVSDLCSDVTRVTESLDMSLSTKHENLVLNQKTAKDLFSKSEPIISDLDVKVTKKEDNLDESHSSLITEPLSLLQVDNESLETSVNGELLNSDVINSIITFSHDEVVQILSEFLSAERNLYNICVSGVNTVKTDMNLKNSQTEVDAALPETRSNTSDEFSGTESMEMPLEDSLECSGAGGEGARARAGESCSSARYTSLVMITQEQGANPSPPETSSGSEGKVTVVTGTHSSVVCLEEGLADDDSWVEDLDRDDVITTTEESSEDEPYPDREEELRGYHRSAIDFTLHTIAEESCEESEVEGEKDKQTELEKYFFYGLSDNLGNIDDRDEDAMSETSSIFSEGVESTVSAGVEETESLEPADLASSRLEKYFLSGFMGFRRDSDGSVGSDSEGRPSPEQRRKRLVRARGTGRQHSSSLDNLVESSEQAEVQLESEGSSTETDSHDEQSSSFDKGDGQFDTVKRTKKKKRSVPSCQNDLLEVPEAYASPNNEEHSTDDGNKTPQPESQPSDLLSSRNKQQSRDSGFVGSCDDLLKESRESNDSPKIEEVPLVTEYQPNKESANSNASPPSASLIRKDSFNNWSSDEETNLMMSKMRAFFKTMVGSQPKSCSTQGSNSSPNVKPKTKPPQLVYFENELTRLMKTVPGLRDEQVREIVEYLSSEDTWSDSYDSSDYTSSDLENSTKR
uniref:Synaptotagmin-like protein 5 n=1 Tax=Lygus hesperus TaxID=30085 RepID=A0A0K8SSR1_LYGHE